MNAEYFSRAAFGAVLLERWRSEHFPLMPRADFVRGIIERGERDFDAFCWDFAAGKIVLAVGDRRNIYILYR